MRSWRRSPTARGGLVLLLLLGACSHGEPFAPGTYGSSEPFQNTVPLRLTYGGGTDPAWLDTGTIIYSFESSDHRTSAGLPDECLGLLPASGGRRTREICSRSRLDADTLDNFYLAAALADSTLAFVADHIPLGLGSSLGGGIMVAPFDSAPHGTVLRSFPFASSDGFMLFPGSLRWLGSDALVFLADEQVSIEPCPTCDPDVYDRWKNVFRVGTAGAAPAEIIPGTRFATSAAPGASGSELYLTFGNDSLLVRRDLAAGANTVVANFGPDAWPRDADYAAGRIVLVLGGKVGHHTLTEGTEETPVQADDQGGLLAVVDAATGTTAVLATPGLFFRRPRLSPDGRSIVAEGYAVTINPVPGGADTTVSLTGDIYRMELP